jgi:putative heme iron utilization protein
MKISAEDVIFFLHRAAHGTLATHSIRFPGYPYATAVPYVADNDHCPVLCVSALAEHTKNLLADASASLSVLQPEAVDVQAAPRMTLVADAEPFEPTPELLARYLRYEPAAAQHMTLDFMFVRLRPRGVRFIGGFGHMGWLEIDDWDALPRMAEPHEATLIQMASGVVPADVRLLGIDAFGVDYQVNGRRERQRFANAPLRSPEAIEQAVLRMASKLM